MATLASPASARYLRGEGPRVRHFGETFIVQTKGQWAGRRLVHEPWQVALTDELFLHKPDGSRVYDQALIGVARKNGKSTLSAELALYGLMGTKEHAPEVYAAAASKEQARIVFNQSTQFVDASPKLGDWLVPQRSVITCKSNKGIFRVLASDAPLQYGLNPSMVVIDELWAHKNSELYYALTSGDLARENPLVVNITTAGFDRSSICYELYERGSRLRDEGGIEAMREAGFLFWWYEALPELDYRDKAGWKAANPSSWITLDRLERYQKRFPESVFRRLHLNQWTEAEDAWIKPWEWDARALERVCPTGGTLIDYSLPTWMAVDNGYRRDSAAFVAAQFHGNRIHVKETIILPEEQGPRHGIADVRGMLAQEARKYSDLREVAYDPWQFQESAEILSEDPGLPMVEFGQMASKMAPASEGLYEIVVDERLVHSGDPLFRRQVLAAMAAPTDRGGWRISKRKSRERIDSCIALAMATDRAITMRNVVEDNDVTIY